MKHQCPVCKKSGLPDFRVQETVCPQCDTDLRPYFLLHSLETEVPATSVEPKRNNLALYFSLPLVLIACALGVLLFRQRTEQNSMNQHHAAANMKVSDSLRILGLRIDSLETVIASAPAETKQNEIMLTYKIRKGDYPGKVAELFYNDWRMYKKIETDNELTRPYSFAQGQELIIKLDSSLWKP